MGAKFLFLFLKRLWNLWIEHENRSIFGNSKKVNPSQSFVSQQCFVDVQMSICFVVLLSMYFRDNWPYLIVHH